MGWWLAQADVAGAVDRALQASTVEELYRALFGGSLLVVGALVGVVWRLVRERDERQREVIDRQQRTLEALTGQSKGDSRG